jgi:hypothetical protein
MANSPPIIVQKIPLTSEQRGHVQNLLSHPGYSLLKQLLVSRAAEEQVGCINADLYPQNDGAIEITMASREKARILQATLDELDTLEVDQLNWSLVDLICRR